MIRNKSPWPTWSYHVKYLWWWSVWEQHNKTLIWPNCQIRDCIAYSTKCFSCSKTYSVVTNLNLSSACKLLILPEGVLVSQTQAKKISKSWPHVLPKDIEMCRQGAIIAQLQNRLRTRYLIQTKLFDCIYFLCCKLKCLTKMNEVYSVHWPKWNPKIIFYNTEKGCLNHFIWLYT